MTVESKKPYHRFLQREVDSAREITIMNDEDYPIKILVCQTYRSFLTDDVNIRGGNESLHKAHICVVTDWLGNLKLIKNRYGIDNGGLSNLEVRQEILTCMENLGFSMYDTYKVLGTFNQCVSEITGEPIIVDNLNPLGITYREYMKRGVFVYNRIRKHSFI